MSWRRLRTLLRREVLATFRDPFTMTVLIMVPLAALLTFGFVLSTEVQHLPLGILDAAGSPRSRQLLADITAKGTFEPHAFATREAVEGALVGGDISAAILIPPDFDRRWGRERAGERPPAVQLLYDGSEAVLAGNAEGFLRSLIAASGAEVVVESRTRRGEQLRSPAPGLQLTTRAMFNPRLAGKPFMVSGTFGFVLSFLTVLITAVSIVNERLTGTFEQLQVTPATAAEILLGKILPLGAVFAFDVVLMMLVAGFVLHVWPAGSMVFFVIVSAFYVLVSLGLGLIISATSATAAEAVQKSVLFSVPLVQLSGFLFPIRNMPRLVQWLTEVFPATHYIRITRAIYIRGEGPVALLPELALLALFAVLLLLYALRSLEVRA